MHSPWQLVDGSQALEEECDGETEGNANVQDSVMAVSGMREDNQASLTAFCCHRILQLGLTPLLPFSPSPDCLFTSVDSHGGFVLSVLKEGDIGLREKQT